MKNKRLLLAATVLSLGSTVLSLGSYVPALQAQPPMGIFPGGPGGPGGSPWGGRGGDRGGMRMEFGGGGGGFDPSSFISRMDRNGNGNIDPDEMEGPARFMLERMARNNPSIDISKPIPISAITEAMASFRRDRGEGGAWGGDSPWGGSGGEESVSLEDRVLVPGFGVKRDLSPVPGFGANPFKFAIKVEEQDLREAAERIQRYDRNRDGTLDANEIREGRFSDDAMTFDQNGDGKLTRDELAVRYAKRRQNASSSSSSNQRDNRSQSGSMQPSRQESEEGSLPNLFEKITSYRMADKDGNPKRPAGLPEWFVRKDSDFDNQVSMKEFASKWTDDVIEDFRRADTNEDGLITTRECLAAVKRGYIPGTSSSSTSSSDMGSSSGSTATSSSGSPSGSVGSVTKSSGSSTVDARMRDWVARKIKSYDKNGDGKLDVDELRAYDAKGDFSSIDTNKDGLADVDELAAARTRK